MEPQTNQAMIETTDALEAVSVCQSMKNILFVMIVLAMFVCQLVFWMNWFGLVDKDACSSCGTSASSSCCPDGEQCPDESQANAAAIFNMPVYLAATVEEQAVAVDREEEVKERLTEEANTYMPAEIPAIEGGKPIEESIEEVVSGTDGAAGEVDNADEVPPLKPSDKAPVDDDEEDAQAKDELSLLRISCPFAKTLVGVCNFVILIGSVLYCLTLLICLKISLAGRLGGLSHIARSFFLSLVLLVVVIPWQQILPGILVGSVWTPQELLCGSWGQIEGSLLWKIIYFIRFCGFWLVAFWLLMWSQGRSAKWARATLRRLGVAK